MNRKRILWISHVIPYPPKAGVLLRAYNLLKGVAARHDVDLVAFIQEPWLRALYASREQGLQECRTELQRHCREVHFLPIERHARRLGRMRTACESLVESGGYMANWLAGTGAAGTLRELASRGNYDLLHIDSVVAARYRTLFPTVPATLGHHNIESTMLARRADNQRNPLARLYYRREARRLRRYEQRIAAEYVAHLTCSELDSERLREVSPGVRAIVVPNGVDCEYFQPQGVAEVAESLVFAGTMNWYPNLDAVTFLLREVWPELSRRRPKATLHLIGPNAGPAITELAAAQPRVTLHGFVPDVRPYIESAALYVCPIRDGGGTKLKILDASAMQRCIVAHPIACEGIDVRDGVHVVLAGDAAGTVEQILRLLDDGESRRRIGLAARRLMLERYSFAAIGEQLASLFSELAQSAQ